MPPARNHYQVLNVAPDAEPVVIEAAYRALMKKYHPDQAVAAATPGPSAAEINHAFATLRAADRRAAYDRRQRTRPPRAQPVAAGAPGPSAAEITPAFATLRDAERRADYDRRERTRSQSVQLAAAY